MTVNEILKRLKVIKDEGFGESLVVIPDFSSKVQHSNDCDFFGEGRVRDGEYAPDHLYTQRRADSVRVVLE